MKKLQNNFTTAEQSKRLLELGVPADSADLFYSKFECETFVNRPALCYDKRYSGIVPYGYEKDYLPCWSVGRLIEIYLLCAELKKPQMIFIKEDVLMMDRMINELCRMAESEKLDFSKLEE